MKLLMMDFEESCGMDLCMRAQAAGHDVRYWTPGVCPAGTGLVEKTQDWERFMKWADLIVLTGNCNYPKGFEKYFAGGFPIFGAPPKAAELELDRGKGQEILKRHNIPTLPYKVVSSVEEAQALLIKENKPFVMKPWGGEADKAMTAVPRSVNEGLYILERWKQKGLFKGQLMMQEKVNGVEMGISAFFGPGGFVKAKEESFEHKKFLNDDLGENTGEMGTVIRHVEKSQLFELLLEPLEDALRLLRPVADIGLNCIIDEDGTPWPLEWTIRLGWPDFCIRQALLAVDPLVWMADLVYGKDSFQVTREIAVGVVMAHGDFPREDDKPEAWSGFPISFENDFNPDQLHWQQVMMGDAPRTSGGKIKEKSVIVTAGQRPLVVTGTGGTVEDARQDVYRAAKAVRWPSNVMYRTDIGKKLEKELPLVQKHGFAKGMEYER
jgi:phosphoribosylamine--glycine ligase